MGKIEIGMYRRIFFNRGRVGSSRLEERVIWYFFDIDEKFFLLGFLIVIEFKSMLVIEIV